MKALFAILYYFVFFAVFFVVDYLDMSVISYFLGSLIGGVYVAMLSTLDD